MILYLVPFFVHEVETDELKDLCQCAHGVFCGFLQKQYLVDRDAMHANRGTYGTLPYVLL